MVAALRQCRVVRLGPGPVIESRSNCGRKGDLRDKGFGSPSFVASGLWLARVGCLDHRDLWVDDSYRYKRQHLPVCGDIFSPQPPHSAKLAQKFQFPSPTDRLCFLPQNKSYNPPAHILPRAWAEHQRLRPRSLVRYQSAISRRRDSWSMRRRHSVRGRYRGRDYKIHTQVSALLLTVNPSSCSTDSSTGKGEQPTFVELPVKRGSKHVAVNSPNDRESGLGSAQIASVTIPLSMFLKNSLLGLHESVYVTARC